MADEMGKKGMMNPMKKRKEHKKWEEKYAVEYDPGSTTLSRAAIDSVSEKTHQPIPVHRRGFTFRDHIDIVVPVAVNGKPLIPGKEHVQNVKYVLLARKDMGVLGVGVWVRRLGGGIRRVWVRRGKEGVGLGGNGGERGIDGVLKCGCKEGGGKKEVEEDEIVAVNGRVEKADAIKVVVEKVVENELAGNGVSKSEKVIGSTAEEKDPKNSKDGNAIKKKGEKKSAWKSVRMAIRGGLVVVL